MNRKNKRIIFALLFSDGFYHLSRNFSLQRVGDYDWIEKTYDFKNNCENIDELAFIFVKRNFSQEDKYNFLKEIEKIRKKIFAPIIIGGGIRNILDAKMYFDNGADKILINTMSLEKEFIGEISTLYGNQSISINLDYKFDFNSKKNMTYVDCGQTCTNITLENHLEKIRNENVGEILIHSMDRDGTGNGFDLQTIENIVFDTNKPILLMGGAGKPDHIVSALKNEKISGVVSANIFNFMGKALKKSRDQAIKENLSGADLG